MRSALVGRIAPRPTSAALTRPKPHARTPTAIARGEEGFASEQASGDFRSEIVRPGSRLKGPSRLLRRPSVRQFSVRATREAARSHTAADAAEGLYHSPARRFAPSGFARHAALFSLAKSPRPAIPPRASGRGTSRINDARSAASNKELLGRVTILPMDSSKLV